MTGNKKKNKEQDRLSKQRECMRKLREKIKSDPQKYEEHKKRERERYHKRRNGGKIKTIKQMTRREQKRQRKNWRERSKKSYRKKKNQEAENKPCASTAGEDEVLKVDGRLVYGRQRRRKNLHDLKKKIKDLEQKVADSNRNSEKHRKRLERLKSKIGKENSLRKVLKRDLKGCKVSPIVRKKLLAGEVLRSHLEQTFKSLQKKDKKNLWSKLSVDQIFRKYRCFNFFRKSIGTAVGLNKYKVSHQYKKDFFANAVQAFLSKDENSRQAPGKDECITKNKIKMQKRYLNDTLKNLHQKFLKLHPEIKLSYAFFTLFRPFWIVQQDVSKRKTCLCSPCENMLFMVRKLKWLGIIKEQGLGDITKNLCCDISERKDECYERKCPNCKFNIIAPQKCFNSLEEVELDKWITRYEKVTVKEKEKMVRKTVKVKKKISTGELFSQFTNAIAPFLIHQRNINHQHKVISQIKGNLDNEECLIHVDFSENYTCKYAREIQSAHFGGSKQQISLHTVVAYYRNSQTNELEHRSFCTLSSSLRHDPPAICAHLHPVMKYLQDTVIGLKRVYFLSDSPVNQYRNKKMFYLIRKYLAPQYKLEILRWHYSEKGHGKGAVDGIGGRIKNLADMLVSHGKDIPNLQVLAEELAKNPLKINIGIIEKEAIQAIDPLLPNKKDLVSFKGTFKIHEVVCRKRKKGLEARELSCMECLQKCKHHYLGKIDLNKPEEKSKTNEIMEEPSSKRKKNVETVDNSEVSEKSFHVNDYVFVEFEEMLFMGRIIKITDISGTIKLMEKCSKSNSWKWPKKASQKTFKLCYFKEKINLIKTSNRGYYKVQ